MSAPTMIALGTRASRAPVPEAPSSEPRPARRTGRRALGPRGRARRRGCARRPGSGCRARPRGSDRAPGRDRPRPPRRGPARQRRTSPRSLPGRTPAAAARPGRRRRPDRAGASPAPGRRPRRSRRRKAPPEAAPRSSRTNQQRRPARRPWSDVGVGRGTRAPAGPVVRDHACARLERVRAPTKPRWSCPSRAGRAPWWGPARAPRRGLRPGLLRLPPRPLRHRQHQRARRVLAEERAGALHQARNDHAVALLGSPRRRPLPRARRRSRRIRGAARWRRQGPLPPRTRSSPAPGTPP